MRINPFIMLFAIAVMFQQKTLSIYKAPNPGFNSELGEHFLSTITSILKNNYNDKVFLDDNLSYEQMLLLLNNRFSIEKQFIQLIKDVIINITHDHNIRRGHLENVDFLSAHLTLVNRYSYFVPRFIANDFDDDDDDGDLNYDEDDDTFDEFDDMENMIIDELEFEQFLDSFRYSAA
ncbi:unnamed protein product [Rotaria sp. Silwood2]|nr:unnamed protein product [Rotaria sp. Silwood2]CAF4567990.1 unnamed protein product [Rotaria sp. Silwood2]